MFGKSKRSPGHVSLRKDNISKVKEIGEKVEVINDKNWFFKKATRKDHMARAVPGLHSVLHHQLSVGVPGALSVHFVSLGEKGHFSLLMAVAWWGCPSLLIRVCYSFLRLFSASFELSCTTCFFNGPGHS